MSNARAGRRCVTLFDDLAQDTRFAVRQFRRHPAFAATAIITLALGIGANTAIFSIVHHVLLDPLPFPDGNRIVAMAIGPERESNPQFQFMFDVPTSVIRRLAAQRTREIGVRVALGAEPAAVAWLVLGDSGLLIVAGVVIGLGIAYAGTRALTAFLYGIAPTDPAAFGGATVLLVIVGLAASVVPTRRALRIDPMEALRAE